jgi:hypothetical protein
MSDVTTTSNAGSSAASAAAAAASTDAAAQAAENAETGDSLLPSPDGSDLDAMSLLYLYMAQGRDTGAASSRDAIAQAKEERHRQWKEIQAQLKKALEAAKDGGFWSDLGDIFGKVAKVAALVAAAAAVVASAGAAAPLALAVAALVLSAGAMAQSEFHVLQKLGVSDEAALWIELGMVAGAAACTGGASLLTSGASGAAWANLGKDVAMIVGGGSSIIAGGSNIASSACQRDADQANADAERCRVLQDQLSRQILLLLDEYEESEKSSDRSLGTLRDTITIQGDTLVAAARA